MSSPTASWASAEKLKAAKNPLVIVGMGALAREDGAAVLALARSLAVVRDDWNGFAVLHTAAARVGGLDLGLVPGPGGRDVAGILAGCEKREIEVVYLLAADEIDTQQLGKAFVIYQGHHGDAGAHRADVILPGAAYTEKPGTYVNTEGRVQLGFRACYPPGDAREDWAILRALSERLGKTLPYDTIDQVRARLIAVNKSFAALDQQSAGAWGDFGKAGQRWRRAVRVADRQLLHDLPDQPCVADDGRVHGVASAPDGGGVGHDRRHRPLLHRRPDRPRRSFAPSSSCSSAWPSRCRCSCPWPT